MSNCYNGYMVNNNHISGAQLRVHAVWEEVCAEMAAGGPHRGQAQRHQASNDLIHVGDFLNFFADFLLCEFYELMALFISFIGISLLRIVKKDISNFFIAGDVQAVPMWTLCSYVQLQDRYISFSDYLSPPFSDYLSLSLVQHKKSSGYSCNIF